MGGQIRCHRRGAAGQYQYRAHRCRRAPAAARRHRAGPGDPGVGPRPTRRGVAAQQIGNQIRDLLNDFYPAAIVAFADRPGGGLTRADAHTILATAPTPAQAAKLTRPGCVGCWSRPVAERSLRRELALGPETPQHDAAGPATNLTTCPRCRRSSREHTRPRVPHRQFLCAVPASEAHSCSRARTPAVRSGSCAAHHQRPHSALGYLTPAGYAAACTHRDNLSVTGFPALVEPRFQGAIEPEHRKPAGAGNGSDPVVPVMIGFCGTCKGILRGLHPARFITGPGPWERSCPASRRAASHGRGSPGQPARLRAAEPAPSVSARQAR